MEKEMNPGKGERAHALLGASSSHRWLRCTPSAVIESGYPDKGSEYARQGTMAHAMGAYKLKDALGLDTSEEEREMEELAEYRNGEMMDHTDDYASFVMQRYGEAGVRAKATGGAAPTILIETRLDYSEWVPDGFGTGDAVIVGGGMVEVIDLKYGKGVQVSAERNSQMMLYALAAASLFDYGYDIDTVRMTIYQPRVGNLSSWEMSYPELLVWANEYVAPLAQVAVRGLGVRESGEWCRFCKAKGDCPRLACDTLELHEAYGEKERLDAVDLAYILPVLPRVKDWIGAVEEGALLRALGGEEIEGYKVVEGRSVRKITDPEGMAAELVGLGGTEEDVFRPKELRTLTDLERIFGKKTITGKCGAYIEKPRGKPTLVPETDKRRAMNPGDDFAGMV